MQQNYETMLEQLKKEFNEMERENMILKMFDERRCEIESSIMRSKDYKEYSKEIDKVYDELSEEYDNSSKIINSLEKYSDAIYSRECICDKLLYKYGVMDGMRLVIDGLKKAESI